MSGSLRPWHKPKPQKPAPGKTAFDPAPVYALGLLTGPRARKVKNSVEYETNVPRCETCKHFRKTKTILINSLPWWLPVRCVKHSLKVEATAICNTWESKTGEVLEASEERQA